MEGEDSEKTEERYSSANESDEDEGHQNPDRIVIVISDGKKKNYYLFYSNNIEFVFVTD